MTRVADWLNTITEWQFKIGCKLPNKFHADCSRKKQLLNKLKRFREVPVN